MYVDRCCVTVLGIICLGQVVGVAIGRYLCSYDYALTFVCDHCCQHFRRDGKYYRHASVDSTVELWLARLGEYALLTGPACEPFE